MVPDAHAQEHLCMGGEGLEPRLVITYMYILDHSRMSAVLYNYIMYCNACAVAIHNVRHHVLLVTVYYRLLLLL